MALLFGKVDVLRRCEACLSHAVLELLCRHRAIDVAKIDSIAEGTWPGCSAAISVLIDEGTWPGCRSVILQGILA